MRKLIFFFDLSFHNEIDPISHAKAKETVIKTLKEMHPEIEFIVGEKA